METLQTDSIPESPSAHQFAEESTTAADGVGGGERLVTTADDSVETPGAMAGAAKSSEAGAGATDVMPEFGVQRPAVSKEQAACPKMSQGVVRHSVWPPSPQGAPPAM